MIYQQHHDRTDDGDHHAIDIKSGNAGGAKLGKQKAADDRADNPEHDVHNDALTRLVHHFAGDEAGDQAEQNPSDDRHWESPSLLLQPVHRNVKR